MNSRRGMVGACALLLATAAGCAGPSASGDGPAELTVFAASSLTEAFEEMGDAFSAGYPEHTVTFNFGASSKLAAQILEGAPADVYASADPVNVEKLIEAGSAGTPTVFALNEATIAVERGNPLGITGLGDLERPGLVLVTCADEVPCGGYASQILERAGVDARPASFEANVKAVVTKVTLGEADAGIVYRTDVRSGAGIDAVAIPGESNVVAEYPIAVVSGTQNREGARAFVEFVTSAAGRAILRDHGFGTP